MNWRRIIATGTVAGMIAVTGCSTNLPETNQGNRNGQRVVDATNRRTDSYSTTRNRSVYNEAGVRGGTNRMANRANRSVNRAGNRETVPNRSLNLGRPQGRIGNTFRYNHNNGNTRGLTGAHGYDAGILGDSAIANSSYDTSASPSNSVNPGVSRARVNNATTRSSATRAAKPAGSATRSVVPRVAQQNNNATTRNSARKTTNNATRSTAPRATHSSNAKVTHSNPVRTSHATRSTAQKPTRSTNRTTRANHIPSGDTTRSNERYHVIPHSKAMDALRENTHPAPVANAARDAQVRHRSAVNSQNRQRARSMTRNNSVSNQSRVENAHRYGMNLYQNRAARRDQQFNRASQSSLSQSQSQNQNRSQNRNSTRNNKRTSASERTVAVFDNDDDFAFFKRNAEEPAAEPNTNPNANPNSPAVKPVNSPAVNPSNNPATPAPAVTMPNTTSYDDSSFIPYENRDDYQIDNTPPVRNNNQNNGANPATPGRSTTPNQSTAPSQSTTPNQSTTPSNQRPVKTPTRTAATRAVK